MNRRSGHVDVHAHFVPPESFVALTPGDRAVDVGGLCLPLTSPSISEVADLVADTDRAGLGVRVLSGPPFTFATEATGTAAAQYAESYNDALNAVCESSDGRLLGLGLVPLRDVDAARTELDRIRDRPGLFGIVVPPVLGGGSFDDGPLREHAVGAADRDLAVLVHPTQHVHPEYTRHYLANLIGNPTESAVGVASLLLGGVLEATPQLRICFLHGGGSTAALLGRWDHGWRSRSDVREHSTTPPGDAVRGVYFDSLTHHPDLAAALPQRFSPDRIVLGSDYPFDMGDTDPVGSARKAGLDVDVLTSNAWRFLGATA